MNKTFLCIWNWFKVNILWFRSIFEKCCSAEWCGLRNLVLFEFEVCSCLVRKIIIKCTFVIFISGNTFNFIKELYKILAYDLFPDRNAILYCKIKKFYSLQFINFWNYNLLYLHNVFGYCSFPPFFFSSELALVIFVVWKWHWQY